MGRAGKGMPNPVLSAVHTLSKLCRALGSFLNSPEAVTVPMIVCLDTLYQYKPFGS